MKKLFVLLLTMTVLCLAACGDSEETPSGGGEQAQNEQQENSGGEELSDEEEARLAFKQFGIEMDDVTVDIEGEIPSYAYASVTVNDPLTYGSLARWQLKPNDPADITSEVVAAYREQIYNVLKAAADDGEVYYTSKSQEGQTIPFDDYFGSCYYKYKDSKLNVSLYLRDHIGIEIYYIEPWT